MKKNTLTLCAAFLFLLGFSGCQDPMSPLQTPQDAIPAGMGLFTLRIDGVEASRTIMPVMPEKTSLYYTLEFYKSGESTFYKNIGPVAYSGLSTPVLLDAGTYDLKVYAHQDETADKMAAKVTVENISISIGEIKTVNAVLEPIPISESSGQGTFKWDITYPNDVIIASMTIAPTTGGTSEVYYFTGGPGGATSIDTTESLSLDTGYYYVTFNLANTGGKTLERKEILHIYQNLESSYENEFSTTSFFAVMTGIKVDPSSKSEYGYGEPLDIVIYAVYDDNSTSAILDGYSSDYDPTPTTFGQQNITITHTITSFTTSFTVTVLPQVMIDSTPYGTLAAAIAAAPNTGTSVNNPTQIIVLRDITAVQDGTNVYAYTIPDNTHIKLNVEAGQNVTITAAAGNFCLFNISNTNSSLTLGPTNGNGTLTLSGGEQTAEANRRGVNVSSGTLLLNNGVNIIGFFASSGGGGVYVYGSTSTFTMNGGEISNNNSTTTSGGVHVTSSGTFTMSGGAITGNKASYYGGGVYVSSSATFTMSGGAISGNTASTYGGGVHVTSSGIFTMNGGAISGNFSNWDGGGVYVLGTQSIFTMSGGAIYGTNESIPSMRNTVTNSGAAVCVGSGTAQYGGNYGSATITTTNYTLPVSVTAISLNKTTLSLSTVGATETLSATVVPSGASTAVTWSSSNTAVATVDASGTVTAVAEGTADITVTTTNGNNTATCAVTVSFPTFNAINDFSTWLAAQPNNDSSAPYTVKLNVSDLGGNSSTSGSVGRTIKDSSKYVNLDLTGSTITSIVNEAFSYCSSLVSVTIPDSVTIIRYNAFMYCSNLVSVTIPNTVTTIEESSFKNCTSLTSITIPASVTSIQYFAFTSCTSLTNVTFATESNIANNDFGSSAFPEGSYGNGGNTLKTAYSTGKAGTYTRDENGATWTRQP